MPRSFIRQLLILVLVVTAFSNAVAQTSTSRITGRVVDNAHLLRPEQVRDILARTGMLQAGAVEEHIGPRPDLGRALDAVSLAVP